MKHTPEQLEEIRREFNKRKRYRLIFFYTFLAVLLVTGIVLLPLMGWLGIPKLIWAPPVYIILFLLLALIVFWWRCPVCNATLGNVFSTKFCPGCGFRFDNEDSDSQFKRD